MESGENLSGRMRVTPLNYDIVILGTGPAGLQAAIHAARRKVSVLVMGRLDKSSLFAAAHIENYCSVLKASGAELLETGEKQAEAFGAHLLGEDALKLEKTDRSFVVQSESGKEIQARALILATGAARKKLGLKGEKELLGRGLSYCVDCDANFFRNQVVAVIGNGSAAATGALTLLKYASKVYLICKQLSVVPSLERQIRESAVELLEGNWIKELRGEDELKEVVLTDTRTLSLNGLFVELGAKGIMELTLNLDIALDPESFRFIVTNKKQATNVPGIFAAGDICGPPFQMAKAVGEGCVAGISAATYVKGQGKEGAEGREPGHDY
ncbi:MAG: FAD-dependent oxidoreductase [Deltaproteobacteria bacterium]|nr:FAD-dependent oxidoreductase [Deltaproteobacteria bacterium]